MTAQQKISWNPAHQAWPAEPVYQEIEIRGAGGGGGKQADAHTPTEAPNSLQSVIKGRILDLIAYGPIYGLVDGLKSVYLDSTPVMNADGSFNFSGIRLTTREGWPNQPPIDGFPAIESTSEINTEVKFASPVIRTVSNNEADAVLITIQVAALSEQLSNGDIVGYNVGFAVDFRTGGGGWNYATSDIITGKTTSPFPATYRVPLYGDGPFDIRVRRLSPESELNTKQDKLIWTLMTEVIDARLTYPNMAMVGIEIDSKLFGSSMPSRSYDVKLSIINVPTNYDPNTRVYTGIWDGTFKQAWSDNPAWCFYDLATHPVIGAGLTDVDKWVIYNIGRYCDELVPDGYGGMEPRFTCNTIFADQEDAIVALNTLASVFRGMSYWGTNTMVAVADMPSTPVKIVAPSNVIDGDFEYSGTSIRERHSVAVAMWNDPDDEGKAVPEVYEDPASIELYGWKETRVTAVACNSRGQARRLCKWILYSERMETQTVNYKAILDHADVRPGDIVELADPYYQGARMGGRVMVPGIKILQLDAVPGPDILALTQNWWISVLMPNGVVQRAEVSSFSGNQVTLVVNLPDIPVVGAMWALSATELQLPQYRVVTVNEDDKATTYSITATEYDPRKYDIVELDLVLPDRPTSSLPSGPVAPPLDLSFQAYTYFAGDTRHQGLVISWTPPKDVRVNEYILDVKDPTDGGYRTVYVGAGTSFDLKDAMGGEWLIRVRSSASGIPGAWLARTVQIAHLLMPVPPDSVLVTEGTFSITLTPISAYPDALWEFWRSDVPLSQDMIESNATKLPAGPYLVDTPLHAGRTYFYYVRGTNQYGLSAWFSTQGTTLMDFDDILEAVKEDILNGDLYQEINDMIVPIATDTATNVVNVAVADLQDQIDSLQDALAYDPDDAYVVPNVVRQGKDLYQAIAAVPAAPDGSNAPPNPLYWKSVGQILEDANGLVVQVQQNTADIIKVDDKVTYTASQLTSLQASYRDDDGNGDLIDAMEGHDSNAYFNEKVTVLAEEDLALSQRITEFGAEVGEVNANLTVLQQAMVTADEALATQITELTAFVNDEIGAAILEEQTARADADAAEALARETLTAEYNDNKAVVQTTLNGLATADTAFASSLSTLTATVGGNTTAIQVVQNAQASLEDGLEAMYAIKLQTHVDGKTYAAGMGINITSSGGITQSEILFQADRFALISTATGIVSLPFFVEGNNTFITSAMIKDATIDTAKITDASITTAKIQDLAVDTAKIKDLSVTTGKIKDLAVETLKIAGRAVTLPTSYYSAGVAGWGGINGALNWSTVAVLAYVSTGQPALINISCQYTFNFAFPGGYWAVYVNGNYYTGGRCMGHTTNSSAFNGVPCYSFSLNLLVSLGAGNASVTFMMSPDTSASAAIYTDARAMTVTEVKR